MYSRNFSTDPPLHRESPQSWTGSDANTCGGNVFCTLVCWRLELIHTQSCAVMRAAWASFSAVRLLACCFALLFLRLFSRWFASLQCVTLFLFGSLAIRCEQHDCPYCFRPRVISWHTNCEIISQLVGALNLFNHKGLYQGWKEKKKFSLSPSYSAHRP